MRLILLKKNTETIIKAIKNPFVSIVVHAYKLKPSIMIDIEEIAQAACDLNKLMEISTIHFETGHKLKEENWERLVRIIKIIKKNKFKVLLGSDAHVESEIGIDKGFMKNMKRLGLTNDDIANNDINYLRPQFGWVNSLAFRR